MGVDVRVDVCVNVCFAIMNGNTEKDRKGARSLTIITFMEKKVTRDWNTEPLSSKNKK